MKIVEGEALVSSFSRYTLPIKNYATGDRVEWVEGNCGCGRKDKKFKLLGRIDNMIQIWSCRLVLSDIEKALKNLDSSILSFQLVLTEAQEEKAVLELIELSYETKKGQELDLKTLLLEIYNNSRDLKDTISFETFSHRIKINAKENGDIKRNSRTGKISAIVDRRN
jgi:phenylacetate-CoA ligase